jgi:hypothetical protein
MDLPAGMLIKDNMDTKRVDFHKLFPTLRDFKLTGYMALDLLTDNGIEEGYLLYKDGEIIAAEYNYLARGKSKHGTDALKEFMNGCMGDGKFDVYEIDSAIIKQVREKNEGDVLKYKPTEKEIFGMLPETFDEKVLEEGRIKVTTEAIKKGGGISREEVLKKYGISHPDERMLDSLLEGIGK